MPRKTIQQQAWLKTGDETDVIPGQIGSVYCRKNPHKWKGSNWYNV